MSPRNSAISVFFGLGDLGSALAGGDLAGIDVARQLHQPISQGGRVAIVGEPLLGRQCDGDPGSQACFSAGSIGAFGGPAIGHAQRWQRVAKD